MDLVQFTVPWNKATARETETCGHFLAQKQLASALTGDWPCRSVALQSSTPEKTSSSGQEKLGGQDRRRKSENVSDQNYGKRGQL